MKNLIILLAALFFTLETTAQTKFIKEKSIQFGDGTGDRTLSFDRVPDGDTVTLTQDSTLNRLILNKNFYGQGNLLIDGTGQINDVLTLAADLEMTGTGALKLPVGTEAQRPGTPSAGDFRFNSETSQFEGYDGAAWGSVGGGAGTKDIVVQESFESAIDASDFTCAANLTAANDTSTPLNQRVSLTFTQGVTPPAANAQCTGPTFSLPLKAQSKNIVEVCFNATSSANDNEFAVNLVGNTSGQLVQVLVPASTTAKKHCGYFTTAADTTVDLDIEVLTPNASTVLEIDDVEITTDPLTPTDLYASSECQPYTPTFSGVGTVTDIDIEWCRNGQFITINGDFTTGTTAASEFQMTLPSGLTIGGTRGETYINGDLRRNGNSNSYIHFLAEPTENFVTIGYGDRTVATNQLTSANGNILASSEKQFINLTLPIAQWSDTAQGVVVKNQTSEFDWQDYTPTYSGVGTVTNGGLKWRRNGSDLEIRGTFTTGTVAASEMRISLPSGLTTSSNIDTLEFAGGTVTNGSAAAGRTVHWLMEPSVTYITAGYGDNTRSFFTKDNGNALFASSTNTAVYAKVPIEGWKKSDEIYTIPVDTLTGNSCALSANDGRVISTSAESIPFDDIGKCATGWTSGADGSTGSTGNFYEVQKSNSVIALSGSFRFTSSLGSSADLYLNGSFYKRIGASTTAQNHPFRYKSFRGEFAAGDKLSIYTPQGGTLGNLDGYHYLNITEEYGDRGTFLGTFGQPRCVVKQVLANTTNGGTLTASAWTDRVMNTAEGSCSFLTLSNGTTGTGGTNTEITLETGGYDVSCEAPARSVNAHKIKLLNVTDAVDAIMGSSAYSDSGVALNNPSFLHGTISINSAKDYKLQHWAGSTQATSGQGVAASSGDVEVYAQCQFTKVW